MNPYVIDGFTDPGFSCPDCGENIAPLKLVKVQKSEQALVEEYANKVINGKIARGHFDKRFEWHKREQGTTNKDLWMDTDFFFSVVFQSEAQKYAFLEEFCKKFGVDIDTTSDGQIQVINGMGLANRMGIALKPEVAIEYPYTNLELRPFVLDSEEIT